MNPVTNLTNAKASSSVDSAKPLGEDSRAQTSVSGASTRLATPLMQFLKQHISGRVQGGPVADPSRTHGLRSPEENSVSTPSQLPQSVARWQQTNQTNDQQGMRPQPQRQLSDPDLQSR